MPHLITFAVVQFRLARQGSRPEFENLHMVVFAQLIDYAVTAARCFDHDGIRLVDLVFAYDDVGQLNRRYVLEDTSLLGTGIPALAIGYYDLVATIACHVNSHDQRSTGIRP